MNDLAPAAGRVLERLRATCPLVHHVTNLVVMNDTANVTLLIGASPVMAHALPELDEIVSLARAVVLNLGTLDEAWIAAMRRAGLRAAALGVPVVLDPVGAGASELRTVTSAELIREARPAIVRGNAGEIAMLAGLPGAVRGVDSVDAPADAAQVVRQAARAWGAVVAQTGPRDFVSDGERVVTVDNGHPWLARVTGTGCMATALVAAFRAVEPDGLLAAAAALACLGIAAERAASGSAGPGSFRVRLFDELFAMTPERLADGARLSSVER
jgi:hydroxyethylthiazole kinase